jgi:hypothetical protein
MYLFVCWLPSRAPVCFLFSCFLIDPTLNTTFKTFEHRHSSVRASPVLEDKKNLKTPTTTSTFNKRTVGWGHPSHHVHAGGNHIMILFVFGDALWLWGIACFFRIPNQSTRVHASPPHHMEEWIITANSCARILGVYKSIVSTYSSYLRLF